MPIIVILFISIQAYAVTLSKIMARGEGTSIQTYEIIKGKGKLNRGTNIFGPVNDLRLGTFTSTRDLKTLEQKLTSLPLKSGFKPTEDHEVYFKLNNIFVDPSSPLQSKLDEVFASLQEAEWNFVSGIELSTDLTEISEYKDSKLVEKKDFPEAFQCNQSQKEKICKFKDLGVLYVK